MGKGTRGETLHKATNRRSHEVGIEEGESGVDDEAGSDPCKETLLLGEPGAVKIARRVRRGEWRDVPFEGRIML
jgi:hypothetical protein